MANRDRGGLLRSCMLLVVVRIKFIEAIGIYLEICYDNRLKSMGKKTKFICMAIKTQHVQFIP